MATSYEVRDRLIARWQDLDTQVTDKQIRGIVDYFVGGVRGRMTVQFMCMLLSSENVPDAWELRRAAQITEVINVEIFNARLEALQLTTNSIPHLPGLGLDLGFLPKSESGDDAHFPILLGESSDSWRACTLTNREVCMISAVEKLTNEKEWWIKCADAEICEGWEQELLGINWSDVTGLPYAEFTSGMSHAVIDELRVKASFYEETRGLIPVMDFSATAVKSDTILTDDLAQALKDAVRPLENIPEEEKDWDPESDNQILNLVDPSLWPLLYGKTRFVPGRRIGVKDALDYSGTGVPILKPLVIETASVNHSNSVQWLPCEVNITPEGKASINSYINNLHPIHHAKLYPIIEKFIEKSLPAWDVVYHWPLRGHPLRIETMDAVRNCTTEDICDTYWKCSPYNRPIGPEERDRDEHPDEKDPETSKIIMSPRREKDLEWFTRTHMPYVPEPDPELLRSSFTSAEVRSSEFFNSADKIQVIVKLSNIHLSPENPSYEGGAWHIDGLFNEHICATALYYYDSDNVTDSNMEFRTKGNKQILRWELNYKPGDLEPINRVFAINNLRSTVQNIGSVRAPRGRALFFPNIYQHRFSPFKLIDPTRPGYCKILALYLVDPKIPIISTSIVGPQQQHWWEEKTRFSSELLSKLPAELQKMILEDSDLLMDLEEAKAVREKVVKDRKSRNESVNAGVEYEPYNFNNY